MEKVSKKVNSLLATQSDDEEIRLQILVRRESDASAVRELADDLAGSALAAGDVRVVPGAGMVMCTVALGTIEEITRRPEVQWVDAVSRAPLHSLLDGG